MTNIKQQAEAIVEKYYLITFRRSKAIQCAITEVQAIIEQLPKLIYINSIPEKNPKIKQYTQILSHLKQM